VRHCCGELIHAARSSSEMCSAVASLASAAKLPGFAAGFDLAQIARGNPGGRRERLTREPAMNAPDAHRVLTGAEPPHQFDRQIIGARFFLAERSLARLGGRDHGQVLGVFEALDQCLVFRAGERDRLACVAHRYASRRWATVSRTIVSVARSTRQMPRQSPWRRRTRSRRPRKRIAAGCTASGAAAKA
jgi:hypothetical protein